MLSRKDLAISDSEVGSLAFIGDPEVSFKVPGIFGIISRRPPDECEQQMRRMLSSMAADTDLAIGVRRYDQMGVYLGWAAHPDSFAARQSVAVGTGGVTIAFSGECFPQPRIRCTGGIGE